jgi:hypothetical protein
VLLKDEYGCNHPFDPNYIPGKREERACCEQGKQTKKARAERIQDMSQKMVQQQYSGGTAWNP